MPAANAHSARVDVVEKFALVVYGGTASGVMTAVSGGCQGLRVALLEILLAEPAYNCRAGFRAENHARTRLP